MKFINFRSYFFIIIYLIESKSIEINVLTKTNDIIEVINNILHEPYQLTLFTEEFQSTNTCNYCIRNIDLITTFIMNRKPATIIRISSLKNVQNYLRPHRPLLQDPRTTSLFITVFFINSNYENTTNLLFVKFAESIEFLINLSSSKIRPRHLFIIITQKKISTKKINEMLYHAWSNKFLDTSLLQFLPEDKICQNNIVLHSYNPFSNIYLDNCYSLGTKIFPNKIRDMFQYPLKVSLIKRIPAVNFERNPSGYPININGSDYGRLLIWAEYFNFSFKLVAPDIIGYGEPINDSISLTVLDLVVQGDIDLTGNEIYLHLALIDFKSQKYYLHGERTHIGWVEPFVALVPVYPVPLWTVRLNATFVLFVILGHVNFIYLLLKICRFSRRHWRPHYILQMILGNSAPILPTRTIERLMFVFLFLLSQEVSAQLFNQLIGINFNELYKGPFETLEDLVMSDITVEMHPTHMNMTFNDGDPLLQQLGRKIKLVEDMMNCPKRLSAGKHIACLIDHSIAWIHVQKSNRGYGSKMKILKHDFWSAPKGTIFSAASPYVAEFNRIMKRVIETGVCWKYFIPFIVERKHSPAFDINESHNSDYNTIKFKLAITWLTGCLFACIVFLFEIVIYYIRKCYNIIKIKLIK